MKTRFTVCLALLLGALLLGISAEGQAPSGHQEHPAHRAGSGSVAAPDNAVPAGSDPAPIAVAQEEVVAEETDSPQDQEWNLFGESLTDLHRASSHFPIGLLMASALFDFLSLALRREDFRVTAFWTHLLGVAGAVAAVALGVIANPFRDDTGWFGSPFRPYDNELAAKVVVHQWAGIAALVVFGLLALWRVLRRDRIGKRERLAFALATAVGVVVVGATGYLGGHLME